MPWVSMEKKRGTGARGNAGVATFLTEIIPGLVL